MWSDNILRLWFGGNRVLLVYSHRFLPDNHRSVRSDTEVRKDWLLKELEIAQGTLLLGCGHAIFQTHNL